MRKYKVGDTVKIRKDLQVGKLYYSDSVEGKGDTFTNRMRKNIGKEAEVIEVTYLGYRLDLDPIHTYTADMLEISYDEIAKSEYMLNRDVEMLLSNTKLAHYRKLIDEALDNHEFETNPENIKELVEAYKKEINKNKLLK